MRILTVSDEECPALWDHYAPGKLEGYDLILSAGDLKADYLSFLVTMAHAPLLYVHGNHDEGYSRRPPEGCDCIDDQLVVYRGLRILGLGGCLQYRPDAPWQFTERQMARRISKLRLALWKRRYEGNDGTIRDRKKKEKRKEKNLFLLVIQLILLLQMIKIMGLVLLN